VITTSFSGAGRLAYSLGGMPSRLSRGWQDNLVSPAPIIATL
jgi:hypothetical protein